MCLEPPIYILFFSEFHSQIFFFACVSKHVCVGAYRCVCMCTWRLMSDVFLNHSLYIKAGSLTWDQSLLIWVVSLPSLLLGSPIYAFCILGLQVVCLVWPVLTWVFWIQTPLLRVCTEVLFPTDPSTSEPLLWLNFYLQRHKVYNYIFKNFVFSYLDLI